MGKQITNFELIDAENKRVVRVGDNAMLHKDGKYFVSNDNGDWKEVYVVDLDAEEPAEPEPEPTPEPSPEPEPDPAPTPDPDPTPAPDPDPTPVPQPVPTGADVSNASELAQAVQSAGTYSLAPGDYGAMPPLADNVRISAADRSDRPAFSGASLSGLNGATFDGLRFKYTYASSDGTKKELVQLWNSADCTFDDCIFEGDHDGSGVGVGRGFKADGCSNLTLMRSEFFLWWNGLSIGDCSVIFVIGNNIHSIRSDGMNFGRIKTGLIDGNYLHDFIGLPGSKDHRDMIQIKRASQIGCTDLTISNNLLDQGGGDYTQGIWAGKDKADPTNPAHAHVNLGIVDNILINSHKNGIAGDLIHSGDISRNIVAAVPRVASSVGVTIPVIRFTGSVTMDGNVAPGISLNGSLLPGNTETMLDPVVVRANAMADPRWAHHFGA